MAGLLMCKFKSVRVGYPGNLIIINKAVKM